MARAAACRPNGRIVIRSGKTAELGPEAPFDQVNGARVIDAAGGSSYPGSFMTTEVYEMSASERQEIRTLTAV
jgi:hypothetical protein